MVSEHKKWLQGLTAYLQNQKTGTKTKTEGEGEVTLSNNHPSDVTTLMGQTILRQEHYETVVGFWKSDVLTRVRSYNSQFKGRHKLVLFSDGGHALSNTVAFTAKTSQIELNIVQPMQDASYLILFDNGVSHKLALIPLLKGPEDYTGLRRGLTVLDADVVRITSTGIFAFRIDNHKRRGRAKSNA